MNKWTNKIHQLNHIFHLKILNLVLRYILLLQLNQNPRHIFHCSLLYLLQFWCFQNLLFYFSIFLHHFFILVINFIIYTFLHLNRVNVKWSFLCLTIQGILIGLSFVLCNIFVYFTFIFNF